ncbi:hypothetical protein G6F57_021645 [Rhizopus arrhizus]|nr:hypothetical protein G6F57_021645 [Rhizopus arrhizus]
MLQPKARTASEINSGDSTTNRKIERQGLPMRDRIQHEGQRQRRQHQRQKDDGQRDGAQDGKQPFIARLGPGGGARLRQRRHVRPLPARARAARARHLRPSPGRWPRRRRADGGRRWA